MITDLYSEKAIGIIEYLRTTQREALAEAADVVAVALQNGGTVNCAEIGHGIQGDFINRAGGLVAVQPFTFSSTVHNPVPDCRKEGSPADDDRDLEKVRFAVKQSNLREGDVMVVSSVSGRNRGPIELAFACREIGVKVIGFTSLTYTEQVKSLHPSGKRLAEAVDLVIDIGAPYGDAGVEVPGYEHAAVPLSGLGMLVAGWLIWVQVMEKMAEAGTPASVLISHNRDGGPAWNDWVRARYQERGY